MTSKVNELAYTTNSQIIEKCVVAVIEVNEEMWLSEVLDINDSAEWSTVSTFA